MTQSGDVASLVERLREPHTLDIRDIVQVRSLLDLVATERTEAASTLVSLQEENARLRAIAEDKMADTRLVQAGGRGGGFGFDFSGGPIPYIAEYLFQFIGARDEDGPSNYAEIEVNHREFGPMTLTMQRKTGKTPHQLRADADLRAERAEAQLKAAREALAAIRELNMSGVDAHGHRWANSDLIEQEIVAALQPIPEEVGK